MIKSFLDNILFEEWYIFNDSISLDVFGHGLNGKELIILFLVLNFVISNSSQ